MPKVPSYDAPQVQERGLSSARVSVNLPDALTPGRGASAQADQVVQIAQKFKTDADQVALMEADKKLTEMETNLLYNPDNGALNRRGKDAFGLPEEVNENYRKTTDEIQKSLSNPVQQAAFNKLAQERAMQINRTLDKHVAGEIKSYDDAETLSYVQTQMNTALTAYQDPDKVAQAISSQKVAIAAHAQRNGLPPEWIKLKTEESESKTHSAIIKRIIDNGDDLAADAYYQANKDFFVGQDKAAVEKDLEISSRLGFAQREADKILGSGATASQAYEAAKQVEDPKKRQALNEEISRQITIKKQAEREDNEDMHRSVKNLLDQNGGNLNDPRVQRTLSRFSLADTSSLKNYAKGLQEGRDIVTDQQFKRDLMELGANPETKDKFAKMNLNSPEVYSKLNKNDWEEVFKIQTAARKGKDVKELKEFRSDSEIAKNVLASMKIKPTSPKAAAFNDKYYAALVDFKENNGRRPTEKEMSTIANQLATDVVVGSTFFGLFDNKKKLFEATDEEQQQAFNAQADKNKSMFTQASNASGKPARIRDKKTGQILTLNKKTGKYE